MVAALTRVTADEATDAVVIKASMDDPAVFGVLYDRYAAQLYRYAHRRLGPQTAEDLVADAFTAAFSRRDRFDPGYHDARPWLFGILTKEIARHRRREVAHYRALERIGGEVADDGLADRVSADVTARAARARLSAALTALSTGERDVLLLIAWGELAYEEVAHALDIPVGTVRSRLNRARRKIRAALGGTNPTTESEEES
jgi:RNA polymerase sigma factor (sigma-70 family)